MEAQTREEQRSLAILIVEGDEATRRILDLSLRNAGFTVVVALDTDEATRRLADVPDLLIAAATSDGLILCRQAKEATFGLPPAVVLISDSDLESKRLGLEAGADDFVARPVYVQEVVARIRALLQRRARERIAIAADRGDKFVSAIEDVPLVDLLRAIAINQKSGVASVVDDGGTRGEIFFRQGRVVDAEVGRLSGRDAVFRLFCWPSGRIEVEWKSIRRKDTVEMPPQDLLMEALRRVDEWRRLLANLPGLDTIFEVDYRLLAERLADIPDEVNRILRLFDGMRTLMHVIDDCGLPDLDAAAAIGKLFRERIIHDVRVPVDEDEAIGADMEGWLSDAAGPFRSLPRLDREVFAVSSGSRAADLVRSTGPLEPPGDGTHEAVDDDMRSRFTDRLQAESLVPVENSTVAAVTTTSHLLVPLPHEALSVESGPADSAGGPITLPGLGTALSSSFRASTEIGAQGGDSGAASAVALPPPAAVLALPMSRGPRSAAGEILVKKPPIKIKPSADAPLSKPRSQDEISALSYIRPSQTATPAGSARALDELPPIADDLVTAPLALQKIHLDPGGEEGEESGDEVASSGGRRGVLLVAGAAIVLIVSVWFALHMPRSHPADVSDQPSSPEAVRSPSSSVGASPIEPIGAAVKATAAGASPGAATADTGDKGPGAHHAISVAAVAPGEEIMDERAADPKVARTRAAEAGTLLGACHVAFAEGRMKDAEAACTAAKDANPDSAEAYGLLAHALFNRNHRREALGAAERAVKINSKWADAYVIIGGVHQDAGDTAEAKRAYERYLELDPRGQYASDLRAIVGKLEPAKL